MAEMTDRELIVSAMAQSLRRILDGGACIASEPPELAEVARLVAVTRGVAVAPTGWRPMSEPPPKGGRYIVAHRGGIGGHAYFNAPDKPGWSQMPDWRPTHWCEAPGRAAGVMATPEPNRTDLEWLRLPEVFNKFVDYAERPTDDNALRIIRACAERAAGVPPSDGGQSNG